MSLVLTEQNGPVFEIILNRPEKRNAISEEMFAAFDTAVTTANRTPDLRTVIIRGSGKAFSAGIDLRDPATWEELDDVALRDRFYRGVRLCQAWEDMPQITVTAMEGMAVGAGCAIALACDWRVLASDAYLYVPEVKIGLNLQWGALPRLVTLVGPSKAKQITLLCEKMGPDMALDWGLIDKIADPGQSVVVATEMASGAASMPAATTRMVKEAINATANALHRATSFADADQSALTRSYQAAVEARENFNR